jgi:hypothetical protein
MRKLTPAQEAKRAAAVSLAEIGIRVFPLRMDGTYDERKHPAKEGWKEDATADVAIVDKRWRNGYAGSNFGAAMGNGWIALDFDTKKGKPGLQSREIMRLEYDMPETMLISTPTGGLHEIYTLPPGVDLPGSVDELPGYPGIDVRCRGNYVVGAGSEFPQGKYEWLSGVPVEMPADPIEYLLKVKNPMASAASKEPLVELDQQSAIDRGISYLENAAPEAIQGSGGNITHVPCGGVPKGPRAVKRDGLPAYREALERDGKGHSIVAR